MSFIKDILKKDSYLTGVIIGIVIPALMFLLCFAINYSIKNYFNSPRIIKISVIHLISILADLLPMRYFFTKKIDKTARGLFLCVFIIGIAFFFMKY